MRTSRSLIALLSLIAAATLCSAPLFADGKKDRTSKQIRIAVFVPGVVSGSPVYEMLANGVSKAAADANASGNKVSVQIVEAGTRQADWGTKLTALVASGDYDLIVSSNPAIPEIIAPVSAQFPKQEFLVFDAYASGNPRVTTFRYNQREQAYLSGYMAALVSSSKMKYANAAKRIGLVAGQEYPAMNGIILPAYLEGAKAVDPAFEVDFRVVGNWYDASKGAELARAMKVAGCDVILPIAGGANQGVIAAAKDSGFYVAWFDDNGYAKAPGYVVSSSIMAQERLAREKTLAWIDGSLVAGVPSTLGIKEGYVSFVSDDPLYAETVPKALRDREAAIVAKLASGELALPVK